MRCTGWVAAVVLAALGLIDPGAKPAQAQFRPPSFVKVTATAPKTVLRGKPFTVVVDIMVDPGYHVQASATKPGYVPTAVVIGPVAGFTVGKSAYPVARQIKIAGDTLPVYEGKVEVKTTVTPSNSAKAGKITLPIVVKYQGCTDKTCYPPGTLSIQTVVTVGGPSSPPKKKVDAHGGTLIPAQATGPNAGAGPAPGGQALSIPGFRASKIEAFEAPTEFVKWLKQGSSNTGKADVVTDLLRRGGAGNFAGALGLIYLLGLALNLTPCVYPLIPITIGYFGRQAASGAKTGGLSVSYALGMALMYSALGVLAALLGKVFGAQLNNPYVLLAFALIMFGLGLSMFDRPDGRPIWEMQLPSSLTSQAKSRTGYAGALLMGLMVGLVAAPCIGPVVVALIKVVGDTRSVPLGLVTFFTLGVGLATPYLLLGFGLIKALPRAGEWMVAVKHIFGLLLFGMGLYYLRALMPAGVYRIVISLFAVVSGLYLLFFDKAGRSAAKFQIVKRVAGVAAIALGIWLFWPKEASAATAVRFETPKTYADFQAKLRQAQAENKEVLIDFWATWCGACKELDEQTFHNADVAKSTTGFIALRVELEDPNSPQSKPFQQTFQIVGLPTVVHLIPTEKQI